MMFSNDMISEIIKYVDVIGVAKIRLSNSTYRDCATAARIEKGMCDYIECKHVVGELIAMQSASFRVHDDDHDALDEITRTMKWHADMLGWTFHDDDGMMNTNSILHISRIVNVSLQKDRVRLFNVHGWYNINPQRSTLWDISWNVTSKDQTFQAFHVTFANPISNSAWFIGNGTDESEVGFMRDFVNSDSIEHRDICNIIRNIYQKWMTMN